LTTPPTVFRCTATPKIGMGHLARCREMARELVARAHACHMVGASEDLIEPNDSTLFRSWAALPDDLPPEQDAARVVALCRDLGTRYLVLDDYRGQALAYQQVLADAGLRWLQQFDSSAQGAFLAPIIVNASPFERAEDYLPRLLNPQTRMLFGPRYAVLRPEFANVTIGPDERPVRRILAAFGGGDDRGALDLVLDAMAGIPGVALRLISGKNNPRNSHLSQRVAALDPGFAQLLIDPADMARQIAECDLGIIAGGTMSYELAFCGVPMILIALAPNQRRSCIGWQELTGTPFLGQIPEIAVDGLTAQVTSLINNPAKRKDIALRGRDQVDCKGTARLCDALMETETL
jgi:UDP-2,4-diacetamido-2,4,6-trideoxy-beta-L-altropyranose hydrolase